MSEKMEEPKNIPHNWDYQSEFHTVTCGGCSFRYGAEHPDSDGWWTCPNCGNGNNPARASSPAQEPVTTEPIGQDGPCFYCGEVTSCFAGDPGMWPLRFSQPDGTGITHIHHTRCVTDRLAIPEPPQPGRNAVIEDVYACCESTLIGFSDELTEQQRKFICDQISRKVALALTGEQK